MCVTIYAYKGFMVLFYETKQKKKNETLTLNDKFLFFRSASTSYQRLNANSFECIKSAPVSFRNVKRNLLFRIKCDISTLHAVYLHTHTHVTTLYTNTQSILMQIFSVTYQNPKPHFSCNQHIKRKR